MSVARVGDRSPIYFYVSRRGSSRPFAVPVHLVDDTGPWRVVRALAGRDAGGTFSIVPSELHHSPGNARLIPGSREAIAKYGPRQLEAAMEARALRKRIGSWRGRSTKRQQQNAFGHVMELAERVRPRTPDDRAWVYFDRDLESWRAGRLPETTTAGMAIRLLDMVLGAAERYRPPPVDENSPAYVRAKMLDVHANALYVHTLGRGFGDAKPWLEVADAFEVSEDAWREAGDDERADWLAQRRDDILDTVREARVPRRQR